MTKNRIVKLSLDGSITSLHSDFLMPLGEAKIERASNVEYCGDIGKWSVEFLLGPFAHACLLATFEKRTDALAAEVAVLNEQHAQCLL